MTLCDTGPLVALIDRDDPHHQRCVETLSSLPSAALMTTWPCLTEAMYLLHRGGGHTAQEELWGFLADGLVRLHLSTESEHTRIRELMRQYADMPLDLADASLASASEQLGNKKLFSLDQPLRALILANDENFDVVP